MREGERIAALQSQLRALSEELRRCREYDVLTGLYNKETFCQTVRKCIDSQSSRDHVVICLDIEHFRLINDKYGPDEGNRLLCHVADLFSMLARRHKGHAARIATDIFALYIPGAILDISLIENEVLDWFASYPLDQAVVPAIGVNVVEEPSVPVSVMCDRAILALNSIKGNYIKHIAEYHNDIRNDVLEELEIFSGAEKALKEKQFEVYFQPKCSIETGRIVGSEALVRWNHPEKGMISPSAFIPLFEKSGFILRLDAYVWETACSLIRAWIDSGHKPIPVSVNVSRKDLYAPNLSERLVRLVKKYDIPPRLLELEITESAYTDNTDQMIAVIDRLRADGFIILMDDFGSGYSSLNMLKDINVDVLKIDLCFLEDFNATGKKGSNILESVVHMSKWLNIQVVAEGVETEEQVEFLSRIGCYYAQGYHFYKPMPRLEFEALLADDANVDYDYSAKVGWQEFTYEDLFQSGTMSQMLLNNLLGGIALYEYSGGELVLQRANAGYYDVIHGKPLNLNEDGCHIFDFIHSDDHAILRAALDDAQRNPDDGVEFHVRRYCPDGEMVWLHVRLFFLGANAGSRLYYASLHNITQQRESEMALHLSEAQFRFALEASKNILFDYDIFAKTVVILNKSGTDCIVGSTRRYTDVPQCFIEKNMVHEADIPEFLGMFQSIVSGMENASCEIRFLTAQGDYCWKRVRIQHFDMLGNTGKALGLLEDITNQKRLEERLAKGGRLLEDLHEKNQRVGINLLHETVPCGMIGGYCEDGFPLYFINGEMLRLLGYDSYDDFANHTGALVSNTIHPDDHEVVSLAFASGFIEGQDYILKYRTLRKDGSCFWTLDKGRIVRAEDGRLAILSVCLDITEQEELRAELGTIIDNTPGDIVMLTTNGKGSPITSRHISFGLAESLGYTRQEYQEVIDRNNGKELVYPPDGDAFKEQFFHAMENNLPVKISFRSRRKDGGLAWSSLSAKCYASEGDRHVYHGIYTDITALKEKEESLLLSERRFQVALKLVQADLWEYHFDTRTIVRFHQNSNWVEGTGDIHDVPESLIRDKVVHRDSAVNYKMLFLALENGRPQYSSEVRMLCEDGQYHWFLITCTVVQWRDDGRPLRAVGVSESIDAQKRQMLHYDELLKSSQFDGLTGLFNRETFQKKVSAVMESQLACNGRNSVLLMMDIDNFKNINDRFGHVKGDEILRLVGSSISGVFGSNVLSGRLGGDEFAVLLENVMYESDVYTLAQQFCDHLNTIKLEQGSRSIVLTTSIGIVFLRDSQRDFNDLYKKADIALYHAKSLGKNMYSVYAPDEKPVPSLYFNMDTSILDELEDMIYVIDDETYNVLYCNLALRKLYGLSEVAWHGMTCYDLFHHRPQPCFGCALRKLRYDEYTSREYYSQRFDMTLEIKEKLIRWNGRGLRLEIAKVVKRGAKSES